jgi:hypothetical protein
MRIIFGAWSFPDLQFYEHEGRVRTDVYVSFMPRVARWYILKPKIPFWVNFGRP